MNNPRLINYSSRYPLCTALLAVTLPILLCFCLASNAAGQDKGLFPDKPYYRVGETASIKYRLPAVNKNQYIRLNIERKGSWSFNKEWKILDHLGSGVIELPKLTTSDGPVRLSIVHPLLKKPLFKWIWVFPDLDPWTNALSVVGGNRVRMRDEFTVVVKRPAGKVEEAHDLTLKFVRPAFIVEGGAVDQEQDKSRNNFRNGRLYTTKSSETFRAPSLPGAYEIRLLESTTGSVLACMPLEVMLPSAKNVIVNLPKGPIYTDQHLPIGTQGLGYFRAMIRDAKTKRNLSLSSWDHFKFINNTPSRPGNYELIITSEIGDEPIVAQLPINVVRKPKSKRPLLEISDRRNVFEVDDLVTISIASEKELGGMPKYLAELVKEYGNLAIRITHDNWDGLNEKPAKVFDSVKLGQKVSFKISQLGAYRIELGAVLPKGFVREVPSGFEVSFRDNSIGFSCVDPDRSGTIRFDKPFYRPGDEINATLEPGAGWPMNDVSNYYGSVSIITPDGMLIACSRPIRKPNQRTVTLPFEGGIFKMRWYDGTKLVSEALFKIPIKLEPDRLRVIGGRKVKYGEPIQIEAKIDKLLLQDIVDPNYRKRATKVMVTLMARGEMSPTGTWKEPKVIEDHVVVNSGKFEFKAPLPGRYEARLSAGRWISRTNDLPQYILARIPLEVPGPGGEVPVPGRADAAEPTDLPFNAKEYGSTIADNIRMADVHCAEFRPLPMVNNSRPPEMTTDPGSENTDEAITKNLTPVYPHQEPIKRLRRVFSATTQPPSDKINGHKFHLPDIKGEKSFLVLVVGQDIFRDPWKLEVESKAPGVRVTPVVFINQPPADVFDAGFARLTEGWNKNKKDWITSMDARYLWFDVDAGVLPGAKRFVINGIEADWILKRGTVTAHMTAARRDRRGSHQKTNVAYHHDEITVEVKTNASIGVKELEVQVLVDGKKAVLVGMDSLILSGSREGNTFLSSQIRIAPNKARAESMAAPAIVAPEHSQISFVTDFYNEFVSQPTTSLIVSVTPARMLTYYPILKSKNGRTSSYLWKDALLEAANIAGKKVTHWDELTEEEAGQITNFIVTELGSRKVKVTVGQHAGMILLRRLFIEQMNLYLHTLPKKPDLAFLRLWHKMIYPHRNEPNFGPGQIEISGGFEKFPKKYRDWLKMIEGTYRQGGHMHDGLLMQRGKEYLYTLNGEAYTVLDDLDRKAYLGWRQAVIKSLKIANNTNVDDLEDMVELTGQGFDTIVQMLIPRLVKLEERGVPQQLVWVPDELARLGVKSIESVADQARANDAVGSADTSVIVSVASLGLMAPVTIPTRILCLTIEAGMAVEAGSQVYDYFKSIEAVDFAIGSTAVLGIDRLTEAKSRAIPGWGVTLGVLGSVVGLGSETYGLVAAVRTSRSIERAVALLPELEKGGADAFRALSRDDQVSVLSAVTASKSDQESLILKLDTNRKRLSEYGSKLEIEADSWIDEFAAINFRSRDTAIDFDETLTPGNTKFPKQGSPPVGSTFRIMGDNGPEDVVLEKFLGQGAFCDVYSIKGDYKRVVKIANDVSHASGDLARSGKQTVINAQRIQKLLEGKGIFQLKIRHFAPDAPQPYMIQDAIEPGKHHIFNWLKRTQTKIINGVEYQVAVKLGIKSDITPDGTLPQEAQRALLRLFKKMSDGPAPLIWEDGHIQNVFLVKEGKGFKAGILDQDRIAPFANIQTDEGMYSILTWKIERNIAGFGIESLRNRVKPKDSLMIMINKGTLSPSADFFMAKMLEYQKRYIKYNRDTKKFEKILFDPEIVEEFFPKLKQWVDPDLRNWKDTQIRLHLYQQKNLTNPSTANMGATLAA